MALSIQTITFHTKILHSKQTYSRTTESKCMKTDQGAVTLKKEHIDLRLQRVQFLGGFTDGGMHLGASETSWSPTVWVRKNDIYFILAGMNLVCLKITFELGICLEPGSHCKAPPITLTAVSIYGSPGNYEKKKASYSEEIMAVIIQDGYGHVKLYP